MADLFADRAKKTIEVDGTSVEAIGPSPEALTAHAEAEASKPAPVERPTVSAPSLDGLMVWDATRSAPKWTCAASSTGYVDASGKPV